MTASATLTTALLALQASTEPRMGPAAWIFMGLAWLTVSSLLTWAFWRVLGGKRPS